MGFVFYDTETTGKDTWFDQILQFGAIKTDVEFNEIDRFENSLPPAAAHRAVAGRDASHRRQGHPAHGCVFVFALRNGESHPGEAAFLVTSDIHRLQFAQV